MEPNLHSPNYVFMMSCLIKALDMALWPGTWLSTGKIIVVVVVAVVVVVVVVVVEFSCPLQQYMTTRSSCVLSVCVCVCVCVCARAHEICEGKGKAVPVLFFN
jgi:high-affinity K+ transport system ATPase subunit B